MNETTIGEDGRYRDQRQATDAEATTENATRAKKNRGDHQPGVLRVLQTKDETRAFYDKIAKVYDLLAERSEEPVRRAGLEMPNVQAGEKVLEVGFRTGHSLIKPARAAGPAGEVFGIALSEQMLQIAQERVHQQGFPNHLDCRPILVRRALEDAGFRIVDYEITRMRTNVEIVRENKQPGA